MAPFCAPAQSLVDKASDNAPPFFAETNPATNCQQPLGLGPAPAVPAPPRTARRTRLAAPSGIPPFPTQSPGPRQHPWLRRRIPSRALRAVPGSNPHACSSKPAHPQPRELPPHLSPAPSSAHAFPTPILKSPPAFLPGNAPRPRSLAKLRRRKQAAPQFSCLQVLPAPPRALRGATRDAFAVVDSLRPP